MIPGRKDNAGSGSLRSLAWKKFRANIPAMISFGFLFITVLISLFGYLISPDHTPFANDQKLELSLKKPGFSVWMVRAEPEKKVPGTNFFRRVLFGKEELNKTTPVRSWKESRGRLYYVPYDAVPGEPSSVCSIDIRKAEKPFRKTFLLGTDRFGRDFLSQLMIGSRVSLSVGLISVTISLLIGITLGAVAGYFGGRTDQIIVWLINVVWSIPTLLLVIAITFALGKGFWQVFIAVGLTMWVEVARVVRGQVLGIREKEYVEAVRALGFSDFRIIFRHILPNVMAAVIVISAANFASAILLEAGLSFLGLGVQPPVPSWGSMIKDNYGYIILDYAYLAILPGIAIMLLVLAFMLIGNALRDALDVRLT